MCIVRVLEFRSLRSFEIQKETRRDGFWLIFSRKNNIMLNNLCISPVFIVHFNFNYLFIYLYMYISIIKY